MEVITKVACGSVIAGGGAAGGAYGVHRLSESREQENKETSPKTPETPQATPQPSVANEATRSQTTDNRVNPSTRNERETVSTGPQRPAGTAEGGGTGG